MRAPGDRVEYSGGQSGTLTVRQAGAEIASLPAVSGSPGFEEHEKGKGPIPTANYSIRPQITQPPITKLVIRPGLAGPIPSGYQEITVTERAPCPNPDHPVCQHPCPGDDDSSPRCVGPADIWGRKRIKIQGSAKVQGPAGTVTRSGFYIHGGDGNLAATAGCIKVFDDSIFDALRSLRGHIPVCVGSACEPLGPAPDPGPGPPTGTSAAGTIIAARLRIRSGPTVSDPIVGHVAQGTQVPITCATTGTDVKGNDLWDRIPRGFVSDAFVRRTGDPPRC